MKRTCEFCKKEVEVTKAEAEEKHFFCKRCKKRLDDLGESLKRAKPKPPVEDNWESEDAPID